MKTFAKFTRSLTALAAIPSLVAPAIAEPEIVIPRLTAAPVLDGELSPGEWDRTATIRGTIDQFTGDPDPRPVTFRIAYDDEHVYVAQRSTVQPREWDQRGEPLWYKRGDSGLVVALAPGRVGSFEGPSHYLLRANIHGDASYVREIAWVWPEGVKVRHPHKGFWQAPGEKERYAPKVHNAFSEDKGVWTSELAIPLAVMRVEAVEPGETWGLLLARDYGPAQQTAIVRSSDWRFAGGWRYFMHAFFNAYRLEDEYVRVRMGGVDETPSTVTIAETRDAPPQAVAGIELTAFHKGGGLQASEKEMRSYGIRTNREHLQTATPYEPITNEFYADLDWSHIPDLHEIRSAEVRLLRSGRDRPVHTHRIDNVRPKGHIAMHRAGLLEWTAPADGTVSVDFRCRYARGRSAHGYDKRGPDYQRRFAWVEFSLRLVRNGEATQLIAPRRQRHDDGWVDYEASDVAVEKGDELRLVFRGKDPFTFGKLGHVQGAVALTTDDGEETRYDAVAEYTDRQGGFTGVWSYHLPVEGGEPKALRWQTHDLWDRDPTWYWFDGNEEKIEPWRDLPDEIVEKSSTPQRWRSWMAVHRDTSRTLRFELPELEPGVYKATVNLLDGEGAVRGSESRVFPRYDHEKELPWLGNRLGVSDEVLPPWTPIEAERGASGAALALTCWGRTYRVHGGGLFAGVDTRAQTGLDHSAKDLLAGPVRIEVVRDGAAHALEPAGLRDIDTAPHEARYRGELAGGGWRVRTRGRMVYDGYVHHRLTLEPEGEREAERRVDRIRLVIPLKPEHAGHLHAAAGDWFRNNVSSIALDGDGLLWHSGRSHGGGVEPTTEAWARRMTAGDFKPYVWIGGPNRGLAFMADNDRGWVPDDLGEDDPEKVHAIEIVRSGDRVELVLNLVARPFTFTGPREIAFSLQATPIRPLRSDARARLASLSLGTAFPGYDKNGWSWYGSQFQGVIGGHGSTPYPLHWDRNIDGDKRKWWAKRGTPFTPYQSQLNPMSFGEVDDPRMAPGLQAGNVYPYLFPHIAAGCLEHGNLSIARPDLEYRLWNYAAWIEHANLEGMYFDQTEPILGANPVAGAGYALDLPDRPDLHGRIQPGYQLTNVREFYRRLRTLFYENGVEHPHIWLHTTDHNNVSAFAFAGAFLQGERSPYISRNLPADRKYAPQRMQAVGNPAKWGFTSQWLTMLNRVPQNKIPPVFRSAAGTFWLHGAGPQFGHTFSWAPLDPERPMTFLPYWDPDVAAHLGADRADVAVSAYRQRDKLMLFAYNRGDEAAEGVELRVDLESLGVEPADASRVAVSLVNEGENWWGHPEGETVAWRSASTGGGTLTLMIPPHNFRTVAITPRTSPDAASPE